MNRESLFSGILIGLGATGYLALGGIPGAVIFAFGLVCVVLFGVPLYTGKAGVTNDIPALVKIWLFNIIGCALLGLLVFSLGGAPVERAQDMVAGRIAQGPSAASSSTSPSGYTKTRGPSSRSCSASPCSSCAAFTTPSPT